MLIILVLRYFYNSNIQSENRKLFWFSLSFKLVTTLSLAYLFMYGFDYTTDPQTVYNQSKQLTEITTKQPQRILEIYFKNKAHEIDHTIFPRTFFFIKVNSLLNLLTGSHYWLNSIWISLLCFISVWQLGTTILKFARSVFKPFAWAFMLVPTTIFWTSGLMKEALAFALLCYIVSCFIKILMGDNKVLNFTLLLLLAYLLFQIKFYILGAFMVIAIPTYCVHSILNKCTKTGLFLLSFLLTILACNWFTIHYFSVGISDLIYYNHVMMGETHNVNFYFTGLKEYQPLTFLPYFPEAIWQGLFMPLPWYATTAFAFIEALINSITLILVIFSLFYLLIDKKTKPNEWVFIVLLYVFISAIAIGFSAPNWGTLARYKVVYIPFLHTILFMYLSEMPWVKRIFARFDSFHLF